jgi:flagellar capping protein FliD
MQIDGLINSILALKDPSATGDLPFKKLKTDDSRSSDIRGILFDSFNTTSNDKPNLELTSPVAGFRVNEAINFIAENLRANRLPVSETIQNKSEFVDLRVETLEKLRKSVRGLSRLTTQLQEDDALNSLSARSSREEAVEATASSRASLGSFTVVPRQNSVNAVLASDEQTSPLEPLGLSGSFVVNGFEVTVETTDTIRNIKDKINFGEDLNKNGQLDLQEDFNQNGQIDVLTVDPSEFGPGVFIIEDIDSDGVLDPSEDVNNNERLDGGSSQIKLIASIESNRLVLTSTAEGAADIELDDDDGILLAIGILEENNKGFPVVKERQFDFSKNPPVNLNQESQSAFIKIDDSLIESPTASIDNAVEGVQLQIKKSSSLETEVQIVSDPQNAVNLIQNFFDEFNQVVRQVNQALTVSRVFERDPEIQSIRNELIGESQDNIQNLNSLSENVEKIRPDPLNIRSLGLDVVGADKNVVQELSITNSLERIKEGVILPFTRLPSEIKNRLSSFGIKTEADNTISVNEANLKRAFSTRPQTVTDIFTDSENGLLPRLESGLARILNENIGDIDLKKDNIVIESNNPLGVAEGFQQNVQTTALQSFRKLVENTRIEERTQNLIAIV